MGLALLVRMDLAEHVRERIVKWMGRLYDCWQNHAPWEQWTEQFYNMEREIGKDRPGQIPFVAGQLLALTAREDDMEAFLWLLKQKKSCGFCRAELDWVQVEISPHEPQREEGVREHFYRLLKQELPWASDDAFITEKEEYLSVLERERGDSWKEKPEYPSLLKLKWARYAEVYLPAPYIALAMGNLHMAEYFWERGGYNGYTYIPDSDPEDEPLEWLDYLVGADESAGEPPAVNVLEAAMVSRSPEMVEWVLKHFPEIPRTGRYLTNCIGQAEQKVTELIRQYHSDWIASLAAVDLAGSRSSYLLQIFQEECARAGCDAEERLYKNGEGERKLTIRLFPKKDTADFYRHAFSIFSDRGIRRTFLQVMFSELRFTEEAGLQKVFLEFCRELEDEFSEYLGPFPYWEQVDNCHLQTGIAELPDEEGKTRGGKEGVELLWSFYNQGAERFPADIYRVSQDVCTFYSDEAIEMLLEAVVPVRLENKADELMREILWRRSEKIQWKGSKELLEKAIRKGFVTEKNCGALLAEACRLHVDKKAMIMLMELSDGKPLAKRYEEEL